MSVSRPATALAMTIALFSTLSCGSDPKYHIWVLDNSDDDYTTPPFDDTIVILDASGKETHRISGLNIAQSVGSVKRIAASPGGEYALIAENVAKVLSRYDASGKKVWSVPLSVTGLELAPNGFAYALTSTGRLDQGSIVALDPSDGSVLAEVDGPGVDLVVDSEHEAVWTVGMDVRKYSLDLKHQVTSRRISWCAVSADYSSDGTLWVAERQHPNVRGSGNRILHFDREGRLLGRYDIDDSPLCLAVDRTDTTVWVATTNWLPDDTKDGRLYQLDQAGTVKRRIETGPIFTVRVSDWDQTIWIGGYSPHICQYSRAGDRLREIPGFSSDQTFFTLASRQKVEAVRSDGVTLFMTLVRTNDEKLPPAVLPAWAAAGGTIFRLGRDKHELVPGRIYIGGDAAKEVGVSAESRQVSVGCDQLMAKTALDTTGTRSSTLACSVPFEDRFESSVHDSDKLMAGAREHTTRLVKRHVAELQLSTTDIQIAPIGLYDLEKDGSVEVFLDVKIHTDRPLGYEIIGTTNEFSGLACFRVTSGEFELLYDGLSGWRSWPSGPELQEVADFDGDGKAELAIWWPFGETGMSITICRMRDLELQKLLTTESVGGC